MCQQGQQSGHGGGDGGDRSLLGGGSGSRGLFSAPIVAGASPAVAAVVSAAGAVLPTAMVASIRRAISAGSRAEALAGPDCEGGRERAELISLSSRLAQASTTTHLNRGRHRGGSLRGDVCSTTKGLRCR